MTRSQVLALLALPAVARRFELDDGRYAALQRWLARSHVAWGLDGAMKAEFGAAAVEEHSFAFGLDRMAAGLLLGRCDPDTLIDELILPADPVEGPDAECLGALWGLLEILREWRALAHRPLSLPRWATLLCGWFERLFLVDPGDAAEVEALNAVMKLVAQLRADSRAAAVEVAIDWSVVREVLLQGLDGIPERQAFLSGGITFCGMVPQRAIPFAWVALIGLNDGDYPRARSDSGLDLMQQQPRLGDRDNRSDDRYLFLEALMSARSALHLSYIGEGAQDAKVRNPALPLAELLSFLDQQHGLDASAADYDPPWRVRHRLQAFDARYFQATAADPRWFSYAQQYAGLSSTPSSGDWQFVDSRPLALAVADQAHIELSALAAYFRGPARFLCKQSLKLSRDALQADSEDDREPLSSQIHAYDSVRTDLVWAALQQGRVELPLAAPARLRRSGRYASGELGLRSWSALRGDAQALLDLARTLPPFADGPALAQTQAIDLRLGQTRLLGSVGPLYRVGDELWLVAISSSEPGFRSLLPLYVSWAALRLCLPQQRCQLRLLHAKAGSAPEIGAAIAFGDDLQQLQAGLNTLLALYRHAGSDAGRYFPGTSYAFALADHSTNTELAQAAARAAWLGNPAGGQSGERDYLPLYNALLAGDDALVEVGSEANQRFVDLARSLLHALTGQSVSGAPQ